MRYLTDTIAGRAILVLVLGLGSTFFLAQYLYQVSSERELMQSNASRIAERILVLADTITSVSADQRDETAHGLSGGTLELHWSETPLTISGGSLDEAASLLRQLLLERSPGLKARGLVVGTNSAPNVSREIATHTTLLSLKLKDSTWLNVTLAKVQPTQIAAPSFLISSFVGALGVITLAILLSRWLTRPLDRLTDSAGLLFLSAESGHDVIEEGTREVRTLAAAINEMHRRIRRLVNDRTQMLAAISHDLRTPLTRLRLRANAIADIKTRIAFEHDIAEMEQMIDAALGFMRENSEKEPVEPVDVAAILQTIADEASDCGQQVTIELPRKLIVRGRHLALKRAIANLVQNAVKYGGAAVVRARELPNEIIIAVADSGPGIPNEQLEAVFSPFYRLDDARSRSTGGYGLGLAVARTIARSHGGDVTLSNRDAGGLQATLRLPTRVASTSTTEGA
ncbi:MAG: hypothetical protein KDJ45_06810 [Hyphomicrobiaceae bacterium]|nr:hypothetical protein [Hyphomicrobiaceae bacterium]